MLQSTTPHLLALFTMVCLCSVLAPQLAGAERSHRVALLGAGGVWVHPETGGHGVGLVAYDLEGLPRGSHFAAELNTDTVRVGYDGLTFFDGLLQLGGQAAAEVFFAGLLPDYYRQGVLDPGRGFAASYGALEVHAKLNLPGMQHLQLSLGVRRWMFRETDDTDEALTLPPDTWSFEPRLSYTYWNLRHDRSLRDRHRLFPRIRGAALGLEVGAAVRSEASPWGALDETAFDDLDERNDPLPAGLLVRQWLRLGAQLHNRVRTQLAQAAAYGIGLDDLYRVRLGGLNPYVVPLAGAPWAALVSERFVAVEWSWHFRIAGDAELGLLFQGAYVDDLDRTGSSDGGFVTGLGAFADIPIRAFQIDLRGGWLPPLHWSSESGHFAFFVSVGWQWERSS